MKIFKLLCVLCLAVVLQAALPPEYYESSKKDAQEVLTIKVIEDATSFIYIFFNEKRITLHAKVVDVIRSENNLKINDMITITYTTATSRADGWVGPAPVPILKEGSTYEAYLEKDRYSKHYLPAAGGKSFETGYLRIFDER